MNDHEESRISGARPSPAAAARENARPPRPMKPSGVPWLGDIPAGWDMLPIKSMFEITLGKMLASSQSSSTDSLENYLCAANIKWTGIQPEPKKQMWFSDDEKEQYLLKEKFYKYIINI